MSRPTIFLSAATLDLREWRDVLDGAFSRAGFTVRAQDRSLEAATGDLRSLLVRHIAESDCVIHLAGTGYGAHARTPFPESPAFQCSWTQFEYYHAHQLGKAVIALVCAPALSAPGFQEKGETEEIVLKTALQQKHRDRVASGHFVGTPLDGKTSRTLNESVASEAALLKSVAAAIGTLHRTDPAYDRVKSELTAIADKLDALAAGQRAGQRLTARAFAFIAAGIVALAVGGIVAYRNLHDGANALATTAAGISRDIKTALHDPVVLKARLEEEIRAKADELIAAKKAAKAKWSEILEIERQRDRQIEQLGELIISIGRNLGPTASPVYQEAIRVLENEGIAEAIHYLQSQQPSLLEQDAALHRAKAEDDQRFQKKRERALEPLLLQAELLTTQLRYEEALTALETLTGTATGKNWWAARNQLGALYLTLARWSAAEKEWRAAEKLADTTSDEATTVNNLAQLLLATNRLADAEPLMRRSLAVFENAYGKDDVNIAIALNNLAQLLQTTNRLNEAEPLMYRALAIDEASFGKNHPNVARDLGNLAGLLEFTNRLADAEPLMRRALAIDEACFGRDHPNIALRLNNLASLLQQTSRLTDAESLFRRALAIDEARFGGDHPRVALILNNLALLLQNSNRFAEAETLARRALAIKETSFGKDHPRVAIGLINLSLLLQLTNRRAEAEPLVRRALDIDETSLGKDHPDVARDLNNLGKLLQDTNRLAEAEPLFVRALAISEAAFGDDHHIVATRLNNLGWLFKTTNRLAEAEPLIRRAVVIFLRFEHTIGHEHPHFRTTFGNYVTVLTDSRLSADESARKLRSLGRTAGWNPRVWDTALGALLKAGANPKATEASNGRDSDARGFADRVPIQQ